METAEIFLYAAILQETIHIKKIINLKRALKTVRRSIILIFYLSGSDYG
jgi:hypothetical protein